MGSFRLRWTLQQLTDARARALNRRVLQQPWKFWLAVLLKLVPGLWRPPIVLRLRDGGTIHVIGFMTLYIYREIFLDRCYDYPPLGDDAPAIIDVGANTGLFSIRMKQLYPRASIVCYEPFADNHAQLRRNIEASGFQGLDPRMQGVGGTSRREKLFVHPRNLGGHSIHASQAMGGNTVEIDLVSVGEALDAVAPRRCALLKLDCEGAELEIIRSLDAALAARIDAIVFEPTPSLYDVRDLLAHLESRGFRTEVRDGMGVARRN